MLNYREGALLAVLFLVFSFSLMSEQDAAGKKNVSFLAQIKASFESWLASSEDSYVVPSFRIDGENADAGLLHIWREGPPDKGMGNKIKVLVTKGTEKYSYDLSRQDKISVPLQMGSGTYKVEIMENIGGKDYRKLRQEEISCLLTDPAIVFLHSVQMVNWNADMEAVKKARSIAAPFPDKEEAVAAIYDYIVKNFAYDWDKLNNLPSDYRVDLDTFYAQKKGICYDYASLVAGMLRSVGIPCRLLMGHSDLMQGYHAWNEVYLDGQWFVVDATIDARAAQKSLGYTIYKEPEQYHRVRMY